LAPLLILLWPFAPFLVFFAALIPLGLTAEAIGLNPGPPFAVTLFFVCATLVAWLIFNGIRRLRRCPACHAAQAANFLAPVKPRCGACGQPLTTDAFDEVAAQRAVERGTPPEPQPAGGLGLADNEALREFRKGLQKGRMASAVWGIAMLGCMMSLVWAPSSHGYVPIVLFMVVGMPGVFALNIYILTRTCPHCKSGFGWRQCHYPWAMPDICASCNRSLVPGNQNPIEREPDVPYGERKT
jgi:hypothetical protein